MSDSKDDTKATPVPRPHKRRRKKRAAASVADATQQPATLSPVAVSDINYPLLCFDTETTNHGELLELSVFDIVGNEVYHSYFKPRAKNWPTDIHHITPQMVADKKRFSAHRREIHALLSSTRFLLGCALSNDITILRRHGLNIGNERHTVLDVQSWYWLLNDTSDREEKQQAGLSTIADHFGLTFGEEQAHSATADTRMTLDCFKALVNQFDSRFPAEGETVEPILSADSDSEVAAEALKRLYKRYDVEYRHAMQVYRMRNSAGYINVVRREQGYSLKYNRIVPPDNDNIVLSVHVDDRISAEIDMRKHFEPIQFKGLTGIYDMSVKDFDFIRNYSNTIDLETFIDRQHRINKARKAARALTLRNQRRLADKTTSENNDKNRQPKKTVKKSSRTAKTSVGRKALRKANKTQKGE